VAGTLRALSSDFASAEVCVSREALFVGWQRGQISFAPSFQQALTDAEQQTIVAEMGECRAALKDLLGQLAGPGAGIAVERTVADVIANKLARKYGAANFLAAARSDLTSDVQLTPGTVLGAIRLYSPANGRAFQINKTRFHFPLSGYALDFLVKAVQKDNGKWCVQLLGPRRPSAPKELPAEAVEMVGDIVGQRKTVEPIAVILRGCCFDGLCI
jgi:hypothetical protein